MDVKNEPSVPHRPVDRSSEEDRHQDAWQRDEIEEIDGWDSKVHQSWAGVFAAAGRAPGEANPRREVSAAWTRLSFSFDVVSAPSVEEGWDAAAPRNSRSLSHKKITDATMRRSELTMPPRTGVASAFAVFEPPGFFMNHAYNDGGNGLRMAAFYSPRHWPAWRLRLRWSFDATSGAWA